MWCRAESLGIVVRIVHRVLEVGKLLAHDSGTESRGRVGDCDLDCRMLVGVYFR
jgi:hypothetical protein